MDWLRLFREKEKQATLVLRTFEFGGKIKENWCHWDRKRECKRRAINSY